MLFDKEAIKRKCLVFPMSAPHGLEKAPGVTDCSLATGGFWGSSPLARTTSNHVQHLSQYLTHPVMARLFCHWCYRSHRWISQLCEVIDLKELSREKYYWQQQYLLRAIWRSLSCCRIWCAVKVQFSNWFYTVKKLLETYSYVYLWHTMWFHA